VIRAAAVAVLLLGAAVYRLRTREQLGQAGDLVADETGNSSGAEWPELDPYAPADASILDGLMASTTSAINTIRGTSAAGMTTSPAGLAHIQQFEGLRLTRYRLGDGGYTIGWGRYYPDSGPPPPERIDRATADAWFAQDVAERGERWVRAYVTAELSQPQFDALVSMAYNLSPRSFRTIADQVNQGRDPEAAALQYVRAGTNLERGLRNRRAAELALFRADPAYYG
jgi:lysozyme